MSKLILTSSFNCGISYEEDMIVDTDDDEQMKKLGERINYLDKSMLRWSLEDEDDNLVGMCSIHKGIFETIATIAERNKFERGEHKKI